MMGMVLLSAAELAKGEYADEANHNVLTITEKKARLQAHDRAFLTLNERVRDPFIQRGPDGYYYLTGTTAGSHWGDTVGIRLWRSRDLAQWEDMGFVWELYKDGREQGSWHFSQAVRDPGQLNPYAIWAPEIHFMNGTWWIPHCMNVGGHGLLKSRSGRPEGPYEALPMIQGHHIDAHLYEEDGVYYYLFQADYLARMTDDMSTLDEEPVRLKHDGNHRMGYEGILMLKINDKYVFIASGRYGYEPTNTYDLYYAISDNLYGPYGKRRMALKNAGHGNLFKGPGGKWWSTAFDHEYIHPDNPRRWNVWLVPVDITDTGSDIIISSPDQRFQPGEDDQAYVRKLAEPGMPAEWEGKSPWLRPE